MSESNIFVLIVEDDLSFALELEILVREIGYQVLNRVDNAETALAVIHKKAPDLILMDNDIKGKTTGIELAEKIQEQNINIPILFITSFGQREYYERARQTNFIGYMVKPIDEITLRSALELAIQALDADQNDPTNSLSKDNFFYFKKKGVYHKVSIEDILFIQASGDYTTVCTESGEFIVSSRLNEFEELAKNTSLFRAHRSYVINLNKVTSIDPENHKVYIGEHLIPYSRRMKGDLLKNMHFFK